MGLKKYLYFLKRTFPEFYKRSQKQATLAGKDLPHGFRIDMFRSLTVICWLLWELAKSIRIQCRLYNYHWINLLVIVAFCFQVCLWLYCKNKGKLSLIHLYDKPPKTNAVSGKLFLKSGPYICSYKSINIFCNKRLSKIFHILILI